MDALLVILGVLLGAVLVWLPVYICLQIWKMDKEIKEMGKGKYAILIIGVPIFICSWV